MDQWLIINIRITRCPSPVNTWVLFAILIGCLSSCLQTISEAAHPGPSSNLSLSVEKSAVSRFPESTRRRATLGLSPRRLPIVDNRRCFACQPPRAATTKAVGPRARWTPTAACLKLEDALNNLDGVLGVDMPWMDQVHELRAEISALLETSSVNQKDLLQPQDESLTLKSERSVQSGADVTSMDHFQELRDEISSLREKTSCSFRTISLPHAVSGPHRDLESTCLRWKTSKIIETKFRLCGRRLLSAPRPSCSFKKISLSCVVNRQHCNLQSTTMSRRCETKMQLCGERF